MPERRDLQWHGYICRVSDAVASDDLPLDARDEEPSPLRRSLRAQHEWTGDHRHVAARGRARWHGEKPHRSRNGGHRRPGHRAGVHHAGDPHGGELRASRDDVPDRGAWVKSDDGGLCMGRLQQRRALREPHCSPQREEVAQQDQLERPRQVYHQGSGQARSEAQTHPATVPEGVRPDDV